MKHDDLPVRWKLKIVEWLRAQGISGQEKLSAREFNSNCVVKLKFEDESHATFYHPIVIEAMEFDEVGIFTEHCGYHIFRLSATCVSLESLCK